MVVERLVTWADILPVAVTTLGRGSRDSAGDHGDRGDVVKSGGSILLPSVGLHECSILSETVVDVAIEPAFANRRGCDNGMVTHASVRARMAVRRRIAAEGAAARLAGAQMNPAIAGLHAFFAFVTAWTLDAADRVDMSA